MEDGNCSKPFSINRNVAEYSKDDQYIMKRFKKGGVVHDLELYQAGFLYYSG